MRQRIAIVGSGISGLGAAWALHRDHDITVFESSARVGGHSNTFDVFTPDGPIPVDTGFIVYNEVTYPHLTRLFAALDVPTEESDMSFSFSLDRSFEYASNLKGMLARPLNLLSSRFRAMLRDIARFRRIGEELEALPGESIAELFARHGFSEAFVSDYVVPMTGAIWSARDDEIRRFPAAAMLRFLSNHGLIRIAGRPRWRTVSGGSREYVRRLTAPFRESIRTSTPVNGITRLGSEVLVHTPNGTEEFDQVVLATHSDQSLWILGDDATDAEREALGAIRYEPNVAVLHSDAFLMPRSRRVWSSWNSSTFSTSRDGSSASVTYWMNRLQNIDETHPLFVSLNPWVEPDPALVHASFRYSHPQFTTRSVDAQVSIADLQGEQRTWFAGAWLGYGFHEDGLQSGLEVAAALGSPASWRDDVIPVSSAPLLGRVRA